MNDDGTNAAGNRIGVILPCEEYTLVADTPGRQLAAQLEDKVQQVEQAVHDPLFMADLTETMVAFEHVDGGAG